MTQSNLIRTGTMLGCAVNLPTISGSQGDTKLDPPCDALHPFECMFCEQNADPRLLEPFAQPSCDDSSNYERRSGTFSRS